MQVKSLVFLWTFISISSCHYNDDERHPCGDSLIINQALFQQDSQDTFAILDATLSGDCLTVKIGASGCDAANWQIVLVTDGLETTSIPPSRLLSLKLTTNETCEAYFTPDYSFDLGTENQTVIYGLEDWPNKLIHNE